MNNDSNTNAKVIGGLFVIVAAIGLYHILTPGKKLEGFREQNFKKEVTKQYFSKWKKKWADFKTDPTPGELIELAKYHYKIRDKKKKAKA